jgi:hypothetical protein
MPIHWKNAAERAARFQPLSFLKQRNLQNLFEARAAFDQHGLSTAT